MNVDNRFEFGKNWLSFLSILTEEKIIEAEKSLKNKLEVDSLTGQTFLDIGSGSGLFSLAAKRLGAKVYSFDYDTQSVACTTKLKKEYYPDNTDWNIEKASILDKNYLNNLGKFDIVYSWGVLHHTGDMWQALENTTNLVANNGKIFISIYNDQDVISKFWLNIKKIYNINIWTGLTIKLLFIPYFLLRDMLIGVVKYHNILGKFNHYNSERGMSIYYDYIDWLGGYPFEVATPEAIFKFYKKRGFLLSHLSTTNRLGCNEYIFSK